MINIEDDDVVVDVEVKLTAIVARDAKRIYTALFAQFLEMQARVAPILFEDRYLSIA